MCVSHLGKKECKNKLRIRIIFTAIDIISTPCFCSAWGLLDEQLRIHFNNKSYYLYDWQSLKYLLWHPVYVANGLTNHWLKLDEWPLGLKLDVSRSFRATVRYDWQLLCWQKINLKFGVWQCFCLGCNWDPRYPSCHLTKN